MPLDVPAPAGRLVGRRTVVTALAGVAAVAATGCDVGSSGIDVPGHHREDDADLPLVREAVALCDDILDRLGATVASHPDLADVLGPVVAMHRAHRAALEDAASSSPGRSASSATATVAQGRDQALADLRDAERPARTRLGALAQKADSGALARLLAAMAAGISQRLADWPR